jgi:hypothetical protein
MQAALRRDVETNGQRCDFGALRDEIKAATVRLRGGTAVRMTKSTKDGARHREPGLHQVGTPSVAGSRRDEPRVRKPGQYASGATKKGGLRKRGSCR